MAPSRVWKYRGYWKNACKRKRKKKENIKLRQDLRIVNFTIDVTRTNDNLRIVKINSFPSCDLSFSLSFFLFGARLENSDVSPRVLVILSTTLVKFYTLRLIDDLFFRIAPQTCVTNRPAKKNNKIGIYKIHSDYNEHSETFWSVCQTL